MLTQIEAIAAVAPRRYHIVVLSDHGQSQGTTFADRYGEDLASLVAKLTHASTMASIENAEGAGSVTSMVAGGAGADSVLGRALQRAADRTSARVAEETFETRAPDAASGSGSEQFLVFGSGNLGLVYVAGEQHRLDLDELTERFPALVPGLIEHPGVGFVVVSTADHGPVAIGAAGEHRVAEGVVVGEDPLARFGPHAPEFVLRAATMAEAPDVYVNSLVDDLEEVAAFEGLVACHGGLGGWQDRGMIVYPVEFDLPAEMVVGADALHRVLVGWLEQVGHRSDLGEDASRG